MTFPPILNFFESFYNHTLKQQSKDNTIAQLEGFHDGLQAGIQASKQWLTKDFSKDLQKDICKLGFESGFFIWVSCKNKIRKQNKKYDDKKLNKFMDQYVEEALKPLFSKFEKQSKG